MKYFFVVTFHIRVFMPNTYHSMGWYSSRKFSTSKYDLFSDEIHTIFLYFAIGVLSHQETRVANNCCTLAVHYFCFEIEKKTRDSYFISGFFVGFLIFLCTCINNVNVGTMEIWKNHVRSCLLKYDVMHVIKNTNHARSRLLKYNVINVIQSTNIFRASSPLCGVHDDIHCNHIAHIVFFLFFFFVKTLFQSMDMLISALFLSYIPICIYLCVDECILLVEKNKESNGLSQMLLRIFYLYGHAWFWNVR